MPPLLTSLIHRLDVHHETVCHIGLQHSPVGRLDLICSDYLDAALGADVQHLLGLGDAAPVLQAGLLMTEAPSPAVPMCSHAAQQPAQGQPLPLPVSHSRLALGSWTRGDLALSLQGRHQAQALVHCTQQPLEQLCAYHR